MPQFILTVTNVIKEVVDAMLDGTDTPPPDFNWFIEARRAGGTASPPHGGNYARQKRQHKQQKVIVSAIRGISIRIKGFGMKILRTRI